MELTHTWPADPAAPDVQASPNQPDVRLALLRGFELSVGGHPIPLTLGSQRLLAFLALQGGRLLPRAYVAAMFWTDTSESRASGNLRSALWRLKRPSLKVVEVAADHLQLSSEVIVGGNRLPPRQ